MTNRDAETEFGGLDSKTQEKSQEIKPVTYCRIMSYYYP